MLGNMYLTMSPLIAGGIANMIFTKTKLYKKHKKPIDKGKLLKDGRRIFGDNKTFIGFASMILFCTLFQVICGVLCNLFDLNNMNDLYLIRANTPALNALFGALMGFTYMLFELPNSFIKRRLGIKDGKTGKGFIGIMFFLIDQTDSLIGVMLLLVLFSGMDIICYFAYLAVGAITHIALNIALYLFKVRKNI